MKSGKVYIVGAGPGDPGLITVKAMNKLKQADVVVYDRLINNDLLSYCRKDSGKIFVGKESGYHPIEQERITNILICKSKLGFNVVRLKGGNPFIFGRGSEEAAALKAAGIEYEIIPGITSGLSAPIYSGIPITQRGLITQCVLITAHESPGKPETQVDWEKLAKLKNTSLIIYMGASRIERICSELIKYGMDPAMPAAVIENGTLSMQRTITARLDTIAEEYKKLNLHPPVIIMISPTVLLRDEISWYEKMPLFNKRIAVIGNWEKYYELNNEIYDLGGEVLALPLTPDLVNKLDTFTSINRKNENKKLFEINNGSGYILQRKTNTYDLTAEIYQDFVDETSELADTFNNEMGIELIKNIKENGADIFIFSSNDSVQYFFNIYGHETAMMLLKGCTLLVLDQHAAGTLIKKGLIKVKRIYDNSVKGIVDTISNSFNTSIE